MRKHINITKKRRGASLWGLPRRFFSKFSIFLFFYPSCFLHFPIFFLYFPIFSYIFPIFSYIFLYFRADIAEKVMKNNYKNIDKDYNPWSGNEVDFWECGRKVIMHACVTLQAQAMVRCKGITKAGNQCSVTSSSSWVDDNGRLVAAPLCRDGDFCAFHAKPFCVKPILLDSFESMVVFILDF